MRYSSYQMERLLDRLRTLSDWLSGPSYKRWRGSDSVRISRAARASSQPPSRNAARAGPMQGSAAATVGDDRRFVPVVEAERERRAGSFMRPPYPDEPGPTIPKVERAESRRLARTVAEGD